MDRPTVLTRLDKVIAPDGTIAVLGDSSIWNLPDGWAGVVRDPIIEFLGPQRRTVNGTYCPPTNDFAGDFAASAFTKLTSHSVPIVRNWTIDQIVGYPYSTSFASKQLLGDQADPFECELRRRLHDFSPQNYFVEHNKCKVILARRPNQVG